MIAGECTLGDIEAMKASNLLRAYCEGQEVCDTCVFYNPERCQCTHGDGADAIPADWYEWDTKFKIKYPDSPTVAEEHLQDLEYQKSKQSVSVGDNTHSYYDGIVEPIDLMREQFSPEAYEGFIRGNIIKYASRYGKKDEKVKEAHKIFEYAKFLLCFAEANAGGTQNEKKKGEM